MEKINIPFFIQEFNRVKSVAYTNQIITMRKIEQDFKRKGKLSESQIKIMRRLVNQCRSIYKLNNNSHGSNKRINKSNNLLVQKNKNLSNKKVQRD